MNPPNHPAAPSALRDESVEGESTAPLVGAQLREKRFEVGLSLRELARRLDVSPSLVSQIETGKIQPSVRTLYAIVSELGLSLDEIFELVGSDEVPPRTAAPPARAARDERRVIELETGVRWERMTAWDEPDVEFMIAVYGVGGSSSADGKLMRHSGREFGLVLSGTLHVTVGFDDHVLAPGDSITFQSMIPHRLRNDGNVEVRAIWVTLGRYGPEERSALNTVQP
jgi:transcriptional regulator with XRE-family HTH domain